MLQKSSQYFLLTNFTFKITFYILFLKSLNIYFCVEGYTQFETYPICQKNELNLHDSQKLQNILECDKKNEKTQLKVNDKFQNPKPGFDEKAKILILHPIYAGSHEIDMRRIGELMVSRGHSVTQVRWNYEGAKEVDSSVEVITVDLDNKNGM